MSSQNFDEFLKGKLDEISPSYHPSAWDRIRKKMPVSPFWAMAASVLPWFIASTSTIALFAMLYQTQGLKKETKNLKRNLDSTLNKIVENQKILLSNKAKTDTIYLESTSPVSTNQVTPEILAQAFQRGFEAAMNQYKMQSNASASVNSNPAGADYSRNSKRESKGFLPPNGDSFSGKGLAKIPGSQLVENDPVSIDLEQKRKEEKVILAEATKRPNPEEKDLDSLKKEPIQSLVKEPRPKPFRLANLKPKLGLEMAGNLAGSIGIGPGMEIELFENLGFNFGLMAYTAPAQEYRTTEEFNSKTSMDFQKLYSDKIGSDQPTRIEEIEIRTSTIEIPIRLKYYIPIKNEYSIFPFAGTHFNLSSQENVKCEWYFDSREEHFSFTNNPKTTFFHNYILGVGIQRKGEKLIWQLAPWYTYNFRKSSNFELNNTFGLSLQVLLPLYKD
jgi:hypothetical protein